MKQKALLIAEKPSLMRSIEKVYMDNIDKIPYDITFMAQAGHLLTLLKPNEMDLPTDPNNSSKYNISLPIIPEKWEHRIIEGKETLYNKIKSEVRSDKYDIIIHAGDPDQEGQLLVDLVLKYTKAKDHCKQILRYWSNDTTDPKILEALLNLKDNNDSFYRNLYNAGITRQLWDWLFGMNGSSATSSKVFGRTSVGRVKTIVCNWVCQREEEIANFKPKTTYGVVANYNEGFSGSRIFLEFLDRVSDTDEDDENKTDEIKNTFYYDTKEEAEALIRTLKNTGKVIDVEKKQVKILAPPIYDMSTLQIEASHLYHMSPNATLEIAEKLYINGYLSYPRTACPLVSSYTDFNSLLKTISYIPEYKNYCSKVTDADIQRVIKTKKYVNDKVMAKEGHTGLIPTSKVPNLNNLSSEEEKIYKLVCKRFLAIFMPPLVQDKTSIVVCVEDNNNCAWYFKSNGSVLVSKGFAEFTGYSSNDTILPNLQKDDIVNIKEYTINEKTTVCPKRYTDGTIIEAMKKPLKYFSDEELKSTHKKMSIGTEATRSKIISTLIDTDGYLEVEVKNKINYLKPTENCKIIVSLLKDLDICKVDMTAQWENVLSQIRAGELTKKEGLVIAEKSTKKLVADIMALDPISNYKKTSNGGNLVCKCPCGGNIIATEKNYFCSRYKEGCKNSIFANFMGAKLSKSDVKKMIEGKSYCKKTISKKDGSKTWEQKLCYNFDEHKVDFYKK